MLNAGILLAGAVALIKGVQSVYQRKNAVESDEFITAFSSRIFGVPVLLAGLALKGVPEFSTNFLLLAVPQSAVIALTSILIAKAYKASDASIVTPMFALSPMLVIIPSFLLLGELPSLTGGLGILLIVLGAYTLKIDDSKNILEPLKKLWEERGVQLILVVIAIYAVTASTDKIGVNMSSPVAWPLTVYTLSSIFMLPVMLRKSPDWSQKMKSSWKPLAFLGLTGGLSIILQMVAIDLTLVSYVISIKRLSIPVTVICSYFLLNETESFRERLGGATVMALGVLLISI
jgi:uncharacterized membrane protein